MPVLSLCLFPPIFCTRTNVPQPVCYVCAVKKDPRAVGCERSWNCLCVNGPASRPDCPFHAAAAQIALLERVFGIPLPPMLPLFPQHNGMPVDKTVVVETLEATVVAYDNCIRSPTGSRLYGGHSFRVCGAQMLAALGVEIIKIMVLARWAGETVLRYIREAPLTHLSDEVKELESKRSLLALFNKLADGAETLTGKVQDLEAQLTHLRKERKAMAASAVTVLAAPACRPFVTNGAKLASRLKVHRVTVEGIEHPLPSWRTTCGFRFAYCDGERLQSLKGYSQGQLCRRCGLRKTVSLAGSESSGSSTSDTNSSAQSSADDLAPQA